LLGVAAELCPCPGRDGETGTRRHELCCGLGETSRLLAEYGNVGQPESWARPNDVELFEAKLREDVLFGRSVDPVCGMELAETDVAARLSLEGVEHSFWSDECLRRYVGAQDKYGSLPP